MIPPPDDTRCGPQVDARFPKRGHGQPPAPITLDKEHEKYQVWVVDTGTIEVRPYKRNEENQPDEILALWELQDAGYLQDFWICPKTVGPAGSYASCISYIPNLEIMNTIREVADAPSWRGSTVAQFPAWAKKQGRPAFSWGTLPK